MDEAKHFLSCVGIVAMNVAPQLQLRLFFEVITFESRATTQLRHHNSYCVITDELLSFWKYWNTWWCYPGELSVD